MLRLLPMKSHFSITCEAFLLNVVVLADQPKIDLFLGQTQKPVTC